MFLGNESSCLQWRKFSHAGIQDEVYLEDLDNWEAIEECYEVLQLPENKIIAQLKNNKYNKIGFFNIFHSYDVPIFSNGHLGLSKVKYEGDDHKKGMQVLNLIREFELKKMKESTTING